MNLIPPQPRGQSDWDLLFRLGKTSLPSMQWGRRPAAPGIPGGGRPARAPPPCAASRSPRLSRSSPGQWEGLILQGVTGRRCCGVASWRKRREVRTGQQETGLRLGVGGCRRRGLGARAPSWCHAGGGPGLGRLGGRGLGRRRGLRAALASPQPDVP